MSESKNDTYSMMHSQFGMVTLSKISEAVITKVGMFTRLRNIRQLGELVFKRPYANHTRYEHSIGVAYLSRVAVLHLQVLYPQISDIEVLCVELAGLLHDIGHGPFSHGFDRQIKKVAQNHIHAKHEQRSQHIAGIILGKNPYDDRLRSILPSDMLQYIPLIQYFIDPTSLISKMLAATGKLPKFTPGLEQIVNNTICKIDTDKFEYIPHDSMMLRDTGLDIDIIAMIKRTRILNGIWSFDVCDYNNIFNILSKRSTLHSNFYQEKDMSAIVSIIDAIMEKYIAQRNVAECLSLDSKESWTSFQKLTDTNIISFMLNTGDRKLSDCKSLMKVLCTRQDMPKVMYETADAKAVPPEHVERKLVCVPVVVASDESSVTNVMENITWHQGDEITKPGRVVIYRFIELPRTIAAPLVNTNSPKAEHLEDDADPGALSAAS